MITMAINLDKPIFTDNESENLKRLEKWCSDVTDQLNYSLNHLDSTNFVEAPALKGELEEIKSRIERANL